MYKKKVKWAYRSWLKWLIVSNSNIQVNQISINKFVGQGTFYKQLVGQLNFMNTWMVLGFGGGTQWWACLSRLKYLKSILYIDSV